MYTCIHASWYRCIHVSMYPMPYQYLSTPSHWFFAFQLSGFIVMKKKEFLKFPSLLWALIFFSHPLQPITLENPWPGLSKGYVLWGCWLYMYSHIFLSWYSCIHVFTYPCTLMSMYACRYSCIHASLYPCIHSMHVSSYPGIHVSWYWSILISSYPGIHVSLRVALLTPEVSYN